MILTEETVDLPTATGAMRTYVYRPAAAGRYPALIFYSEIFQRTGPIGRTAALLAGHGYVVAVPEIFHELEAPGTVLAYDTAGAARGNGDKIEKTLASYDEDTRALVEHLRARPDCDGKLGAFGVCIGGHLALRAALRPEIRAAVSFYATDLQKGSLSKNGDDTLARAGEIKAELLFGWGRQDPHIPDEARATIHARLTAAKLKFTWLEWNAAHAFLRDEGARFDPELALLGYRATLDFFRRVL